MELKTSTPIVIDKLIPPPPRKLWATDSPAEHLYRNKWTKYRNSMEEKESWSAIEAPRFIDFEDIPEPRDSYFDTADEGKYVTPQRTLAKRLPGLDSENNNNLLESLNNCCLSAIKKCDPDKTLQSSFNMINNNNESFENQADSTIKAINQDKADIKAPKPPDYRGCRNKAEDVRSGNTKIEKKNRSDSSGGCTIVEPFSFEDREKSQKEHRRARRERDSMGKETWKGFRANPVPKFLKIREKNKFPATSTTCADNKNKISEANILKLHNAAEVWKKKAFEPSHPKKEPIKIKPPQLLTAIRARERQRFEEHMKEKELQRQAALKIEEAARKKREEEEIAKLRKQLVHKAQPIRKYKLIVPRVEKRPLADPMTQMTCKRRRML